MTLIMGIVNVTPDSFSDGGAWADPDAAIRHALDLVGQGADIIDVGGESTRPGAERVDVDEEQRRVLPVVAALADRGIPVSVDTMNAATATAAAAAGAAYINDVSGGLADPDMYRVMVDNDAKYIAMHWRGHLGRADSTSDDALARYDDVVADVRRELEARVAAMTAAGIDPFRVVLDPGLGFSKRPEHNWQLLARIDELAQLGLPILIGASRKRFLSRLGSGTAEALPADRDGATAIVSALAAVAGVWAVRVHNVAATRAALDVADAWTAGMRR